MKKRIIAVLIVGAIAVSAVSAQAMGRGRYNGNVGNNGIGNNGLYGTGLYNGIRGAGYADAGEAVKVDGKLAIVNGMTAVKEKNTTYYVNGVNRLVGVVDGLKENASVKLEGYAVALPAAPEYKHLMVTKLTFNGKDYDLTNTYGGGYQMGTGRGRGRW